MLQGHAPEMVVDGRTLSRILGTASEPLLAELANMCSGVVVCRASPSQKATIVRMMKRFQTAQLAGTVSARLRVDQHVRVHPDMSERPAPQDGTSRTRLRRLTHTYETMARFQGCTARRKNGAG